MTKHMNINIKRKTKKIRRGSLQIHVRTDKVYLFSPLPCECDYQRTIGGKEVFKSPTSQVGAGHNAQPGEEEPIFL